MPPKRKAAVADGGAGRAEDKGASSKKKGKAAKEAGAVPPAAQTGKGKAASSSSIPVDAALLDCGKLHGSVTVHQDYAYLANQASESSACARLSAQACVRACQGASTNMFVRCLCWAQSCACRSTSAPTTTSFIAVKLCARADNSGAGHAGGAWASRDRMPLLARLQVASAATHRPTGEHSH
jgi:hypothetical protein